MNEYEAKKRGLDIQPVEKEKPVDLTKDDPKLDLLKVQTRLLFEIRDMLKDALQSGNNNEG
jgi:hypothetical protein